MSCYCCGCDAGMPSTISTGYLLMQSSHGPLGDGLTFRSASHTALLHLNPLPKAICQIRCPLLILPFASIYASSYQMELDEVLPNRWRVIRDASTWAGSSWRFFSSSSITALPPAWMQKWSNASLKSGM